MKSLTRLGERPDTGLGEPRILLKQWMLKNQITVNQLAIMCCISRHTVDYLLRGEWRSKSGYIQLHQAYAIEWATQGEVPAWLWLTEPAYERRIRGDRVAKVMEFETRCKRHVLKWASLKTPDGMLREKARVLSRLFNVQWSEVKARAWLDAERSAQSERADISHLLAPEDKGPTADGIYVSESDQEMTDEEWFKANTQATL
jgi:hypothetical protein